MLKQGRRSYLLKGKILQGIEELQLLPQSFFNRSSLTVAEDLIGKVLLRKRGRAFIGGIIVETEAYVGIDDRASHAYRGRKTRRNTPMFGPPGSIYVYLIYGRYHCLNIVTNKEGFPDAVLIRAIHPLIGLEEMARARKIALPPNAEIPEQLLKSLTGGPGRLTQALGIDLDLNGKLLGDELLIVDMGLKLEVVRDCRIGVSYAGEDALKPYRFLAKSSPAVSHPPGYCRKYRRGLIENTK